MKILTIVGARPQLVKAAMVSRVIVNLNQESSRPRIVEEIIHTGQHYNENTSDIFFAEMQIPEPVSRLNFGGRSHGAMTGQMLEAVEGEIVNRQPDWVLVYGDTNSTLAGALAAAKLHVPVAHVEAGLRSYNKRMPEEINRILTDHVSGVLFCPTETAVKNLKAENITEGVHQVGDIMYDAALAFGDVAERTSDVLTALGLTPKSYYLATVHRQENTDDPARLAGIFSAFDRIATEERPIVVPLHPRTRLALARNSLAWAAEELPVTDSDCPVVKSKNGHIHLIPSISFTDMIMLEKNARIILTDSGGVQKEAYWHRVPCLTLRGETEWVETVETGWNRIVGAECDRVVDAVTRVEASDTPMDYPLLFGSGDAASLICTTLMDEYRQREAQRVRKMASE